MSRYRHHQRVLHLSDAALDIVTRRAAAAREGREREGDVSLSLIVNSIIIRYDEMMRELDPQVDGKFEPEELEAMLSATAGESSSRRHIVLVERGVHRTSFRDLMKTCLANSDGAGLNAAQVRTLLDLLARIPRPSELFALADRLNLQLTQRVRSRE